MIHSFKLIIIINTVCLMHWDHDVMSVLLMKPVDQDFHYESQKGSYLSKLSFNVFLYVMNVG